MVATLGKACVDGIVDASTSVYFLLTGVWLQAEASKYRETAEATKSRLVQYSSSGQSLGDVLETRRSRPALASEKDIGAFAFPAYSGMSRNVCDSGTEWG